MSEEPSLRSMLKTRIRATLLGAAVGDALGFPYEGSTRQYMVAVGDELTEKFQSHISGYYPAGQYSDDTQMTLATLSSILEVGAVCGENVASKFESLWKENRIIGRGAACSEAVNRLISGESWEDSGAAIGRAGNGAAMRAAALGIWHFDEAAKRIEDTIALSRITHTDPLAVGGAIIVASAVAHNLTHRELILGDFLDQLRNDVIEECEEWAEYLESLPRILSLREEEALDEITVLGLTDDQIETRDGITSFVIPTVMVALYYFLRSPQDYELCIGKCLLAGGDVDTTASIAGAIAGAFNGETTIPKYLLAGLQDEDLVIETADRVYSTKMEERALRR